MKINSTIFANGRTYKVGQEALLERDGYTEEQKEKWVRTGKLKDEPDTLQEDLDSWDPEPEGVTLIDGSISSGPGTINFGSEDSTFSPGGEWGERLKKLRNPDATDSAKTLASQNNIPLSSVEGTGQNGRITVKDVRDKMGAES